MPLFNDEQMIEIGRVRERLREWNLKIQPYPLDTEDDNETHEEQPNETHEQRPSEKLIISHRTYFRRLRDDRAYDLDQRLQGVEKYLASKKQAQKRTTFLS